MKKIVLSLLVMVCVTTIACNGSANESEIKTKEPGAATENKSNQLSMKIDGKLWEADSNIFALFHPNGHNKAIMIGGSKGGKTKDEQVLNINLYNTGGPATFLIKNDNPDLNVAQLANMSPENYLYGSMMGFDMRVIVTKASGNPNIVEATFEGEMSGNASDKIKITEGKFYYHE